MNGDTAHVWDFRQEKLVERKVGIIRYLTQWEQFAFERMAEKSDSGIKVVGRITFGNGEYGLRYAALD